MSVKGLDVMAAAVDLPSAYGFDKPFAASKTEPYH